MDEIEGARAALEGGCKWIQLRMKEASDEEFVAVGRVIGKMCKEAGAKFILDDRVHLVETLDADGVHVGKKDMPVREARKILGPDRIIGATANTLDDALKAVKDGADYLGIGPFRFTTTKQRLAPVLGLDGLTELMTKLREVSDIPVVAIGGIKDSDIRDIMRSGVTGIAVSGNILNAPSPKEKTEIVLNEINISK
ncbi:MAG: thiamine phosphate synthase [Muribaculaceae bacterium]|nr:thiamine phosphate synthase [Muribaculaceae bacterium]